MCMHMRTRGCYMTVTETSQTKQPTFKPVSFITHFKLASKPAHQYNFVSFQEGKRDHENNQLVSFKAHFYID